MQMYAIRRFRCLALVLAALAPAALALGGCADRPVFGIELGSQRIQDCVPGSVSRPCP